MTYIDEIVKQAQADLEAKKDELLMSRVKILDPYFDAKKESEKMFPRIKRIMLMGDEIWYWNNGTDKGYRIITFRMMPMTDQEMMNSSRKFSFNFIYF